MQSPELHSTQAPLQHPWSTLSTSRCSSEVPQGLLDGLKVPRILGLCNKWLAQLVETHMKATQTPWVLWYTPLPPKKTEVEEIQINIFPKSCVYNFMYNSTETLPKNFNRSVIAWNPISSANSKRKKANSDLHLTPCIKVLYGLNEFNAYIKSILN